MDDPRLREDTTAIIAYLQDMRNAMTLLDQEVCGTIFQKRMSYISDIEEQWIPGGTVNPGYWNVGSLCHLMLAT